MDFGKIADILSFIWLEAVELDANEYMPSAYWKEYQDELQLAAFVSAGWATLTEQGNNMLEVAWDTLCEVRELDPNVMYDSIKDFFDAQAVEAEVIPIEKGKK